MSSVQKNSGQRIRVAIVDDSAVIRGILKRQLEPKNDVEIVGSFSDGARAVAGLADADPDVLVLDVEMPNMDGLTALPKLLEIKPRLSVIMASSLTQRNADVTLKALRLGAADYIAKPESRSLGNSGEDYLRDLLEKIRALGASARRKKAFAAGDRSSGPARPAAKSAASNLATAGKLPLNQARLLAIGSSTGGPRALELVLRGLGPNLAVPIVIAQHMPAAFTPLLAEHLGKAAECECAEGRDGEALRAGKIYVAPGDYHMTIEAVAGGFAIRLDQSERVNFCRPAVDNLFKSVAATHRAGVLGLVLTGMGHDGREGAKAIVDAGGAVIAQDEDSSVVWGMPGAVVDAGLASGLLTPDEISKHLEAVCCRRRRETG